MDEPNKNIETAARILNTEGKQFSNLADIYADNDANSQVDQVSVETDQSNIKVLHMAELLLGHKDSDVGFYSRVLEAVKDDPPDVIVLSGLMQGDFRFLEKRRQATLVPGITKMSEQFKFAKELLDSARDIAPVVYNMSNDDRRICEDYTISVFKEMLGLANKADVPYWKIDQMRQHPKWQEHLRFQIDTVFPYCLRQGRSLDSIEEYMELYEDGVTQPEDNLFITDDVDLELLTKKSVYTEQIRHYMGFSPQPMYMNHMKTPMDAVGQLRANGKQAPDGLVIQHNQEAVGVNKDETWVISLGGLLRASNFLHSKGSKTDAAGDVSRRLITTRRRAPYPNATEVERTDDGRTLITIFNDALMEKSFSLPERTAVTLFCDWQTGSITARPDLQVKFMDYVHEKLGMMAVALFVGGDIVHGRNYPDFPSESQSTGLMSMESQIAFAKSLITESIQHLSKSDVENLVKVIVEPGNHEWNSGTQKWHGYSFTEYIRDAYEGMYLRRGIEPRVAFHNALVTPKGEFVRSFTGVDYLGSNGVTVQHFALERGAKGGMSGLPVYQAQEHDTGLGELKANIDYQLYGHWHHPQYGVFGNKLAIVGGSLAGLSGYEWWRGYRPVISGTLLHIGGGKPPQIEFVSERFLSERVVRKGRFTSGTLKSEGYKDDREFDSARHGIFMPRRYPKSALQKSILHMMQDASQSADTHGELR